MGKRGRGAEGQRGKTYCNFSPAPLLPCPPAPLLPYSPTPLPLPTALPSVPQLPYWAESAQEESVLRSPTSRLARRQ